MNKNCSRTKAASGILVTTLGYDTATNLGCEIPISSHFLVSVRCLDRNVLRRASCGQANGRHARSNVRKYSLDDFFDLGGRFRHCEELLRKEGGVNRKRWVLAHLIYASSNVLRGGCSVRRGSLGTTGSSKAYWFVVLGLAGMFLHTPRRTA